MAQVSFKNVRSGMSKNLVLRSPEAFEAGKHIGEEPRGLVGTFVDNIAGGLEGFASGGLNALGTAGKAFYINGEAPRAVGEMGKWLVDRSIGLDEMAAENQRRSGLLKEYEEQGLLDRVTNPKYWMDARGFAADFGNLFGSQIPFFAMSAVMPEIGVAAKVSQALNSGLGKVGLNRAAGLFAPRVKALVGGEERTLAGGAGREALGDFTSWAPTGVIDAASNTGDVAQYLREQGYSDDEIYERMKKAFGYELPYDIASQGLFGTFMGGRGVRAALSGKSKARNIGVNAGLGVVDAFNEGFQEHVQTQAVEGATDQPVGTLWNQTPGERSASTSAIIGSAVPILGGAVRNVLGSHFANSNEGGTTEVTTTEQQSEESAQPKIKTSGNADIDSIMTDAAAEYNVPVNLIHAVAQTESGYNQDARSEAGAIGVMQLMPETAEGLGVDPTDLRGNIYGGAKYLRQLMDTFGGDMQKVIAAYNAGPGAVQKHGGIPPYEETQNYVQKVMGNLEGYDLGASGDVPVQVRSLADDAAPFIGVTMSNGTEGCVEAVTKIGANSSAFLAQELKKGVVGVDRLVEDAGDNVIAFDPNQLEEGDVIVYGDESDPQRHVVLYDGKGGYIGNSSSRNQVVHESDYNQMGDWHPTKIIKSGASFRGTSVRSISAPQMDFTGLVFDEKDIAATQKALNNLVHGGQPTPEQSAAILSAAEAIRDMPLGSVDKTAEAESYNEWQNLIDTKDIAGIVDKDPEGVARMVHQLAGAQKQQQTRAAIENQQQIEATKQALEAVQKQRYEAAQARINNAVAQRNAAMQNPQMQAETPMQASVQTPQIPMQTAPTNNIVGDTVVENVAPQTFSSPVEEAAKSLPVSREELSDILGKVQQWEQPLLSIPAYVQARDRQDWATAAQIAANAGQPGVAQFYNTLMEHGSRNAQNVTPAPQENAPTVTPYAPQENVVAAPPVQNASAPIPVVGVRPLVPERLPDSTTGRRDLAHALGRFMVANNIPISKGLRDDLSIGYGKAIRYADEKIRKWENERAGNAPQTAQGGAQSTEAQADDRMLAQRGERAQNGSKAVRGKSAQKQGNKKAADKGGVVLAGDKPLTQQTKKDRLIYSSPGLGAATESNAGAVSASAKKVGADTRGGTPASDKSGDLDTSTISPEEAESKENPLHEDEQTALKGLSADAKDVYRLVRDKLADSSNKKVARAASVGAVLLARHADIIARKIRTALGKPFTAMDYYRNMFALKTEGDKTGANALHQAAMKKSDTTSLSEFSRQMRKPEAGSGSRKKMFLRITAPSGAFVDVAQDDMIHMHNHHPEMTDEDFAVIQENMENFLRVHQDKTEKGDYGGETVLCKIKTPRGIAGVSYELLPTGRIFLKTAFFDNERGIDNWITKNGTSKDIMDAGTRKRGDAASMLTGHPSRTADVADSLTPSDVQPLSLFMIQERIGVVNGEKFNQSAWHGTPHDFDAFDLGAIGTGEGAQVHGWGLYFAKVRSTSDGYREGLTEKSKVYSNEQVYTFEKNGSIKTNDGEILRPNNPLETALHSFQSHDGDIKAAIAFQQSILARERDYLEKHKDFFAFLGDNVNNEDTPAAREVRILQETIRILENEAKTWRLEKHKGATFEVEIPDNDVLLDEDKPFEYQPPFVQEKLLELFQNLLEQRTPQFLMDTHEFGDSVRDGSMAKERVSNATGKEIYDDLIDIFDKTPKEASLALNNVGIKGITYVGRQDGRCFVVFDDKAISIINKFNQQMNEVIKGTTQDIPNGQRIISLFEAADESTFLHEMGHLFLLDLEHLAPMSPTAEKDLATVKKWAEWREGQAAEYKGTPFARSFAELDKKIRAALSAGNDRRADNLKRQWEHERFARGFEMYLKTGDAPTKGLRAVFAKFRAFLQRVYQAFTGTGGKATPEVEAVMARMISIEDSSDLSAYPRGKETEVYTDSGKSIPVQYRVVSADDLIASHDASALEINPGYPAALQPRDRERVVMRQQVERMSNTLRPEELGEGRNLNQGAPLIRSDGVVLNGNGRTIAIARAQARNKERAAAYRNYLMENAETFGLSREAVERVDNPVLVREVQGDISANTMNNIIGSTTGGSRMGASENAQADADKLTHTVMDTYVPNEKGDLTTAANRDFVAGVLHKVVGQGELNAYLDKDGHVNADGIQRVKRALFAAAYGDDEIVAKMAESTDDDTRNVSNGLMAAAPMMARLSVKKDVPHIRELRDAIADAVKQLDTLRASGDSVKDYLGAQALFSEHEDSAEMREILFFLDDNKRSGKRIGNYFTHIAESLDGMENPTDSDLFETQLPSLMDVLEEARTHAETGGQDGLFGDSAEEDTRVQENIARGKKAMRTVVATHQDVPNAMNRPDIGTIDFVWGKAGQGAKFKKGNGIAHILAKHVPESGTQLLDRIVETIAKGNVIQEKTAGGSTQSRLVLEHNGYVALLSMNDESGGWLLSGWETYDNMKKRASSANGEGDGSTVATATAPMRSRRGGEDALSSDSNIAQEEAEGKQEPTLGLFFQTEPALEKVALEYGAKSENGKVTFTDAAQEKEFLQVAKALLSAGARKFSKAWTGSAADYDVPSLDYVGTGTGGAAYGYGLYYAEKRKTAEGYGDKLYHAEIPDADVLLDAGKSFDEQPPKVRKALEKLVRGLTLEQLENWNDVRRMGKAKVVAEIMDALSEADGTNIYGTISDLAEGQKEASELLNKYGVKGAVYNDEQNGRTFVVFDDKAIKILEKFSARRQEEIKKMLDGITLVSPNRLSPRKCALRDWGHEMGVPVVFFKGDPSLHGFHSDGVTFLNVDSEITPQWTFWHEAMHWMKANNPDLYNDIVHEISGAEGFTKEQLDAYRKEIGAEHMSDADVIEEMIADALPDVRRRVPLLRDVGKRDTGIVERLVAWVHDVMRRFHDHFFTPKGGLTNDQRRAMVRAFGNLVGSIRDADGKQIFRVANDGARITLRDGRALPAVKYSLDKAGREEDNESKISDAVFGKYLNDGIMKMVQDKVSAEIGEHVDLSAMSDPVARDAARDKLPYIRQMLTWYNQRAIQENPAYKNRMAVKIEYARRCFDNDPRIQHGTVRPSDRDKGQGRIHQDRNAVVSRNDKGRGSRDNGRSTRGVSRSVSGERSGARAHFDKLYEDMRKHLESQGAFSMPKFSARTNGESPKGNFKLLKDRIRNLVGVTPVDNVELPGRISRTVTITPKELEHRIEERWIQKKNIISEEKQKNGKITVTYYPDTHDVGYADYAKSVRQVAKRNPFVKALYDLASKAMHKQEKLRNDFAKSLKEFAELVKNPADMEKVTEILWTGDATGKEYTSAELRAAGASDNVVRAYTLVRRELKKAYELLNETRMQVKTRSKVLRPEDVESYMQSHWIRPSDVLSKTQTQDGNIELTWRGGKTYETKNKLMSAEELSLMEKDENINVTRAVPANAKAYGAGMYHVGYVERIKPINNLTGYMPHFFHEWMVYEQYKDPVSKEIRYTSVGSGRTLNEAVNIGNTIAEKNKDRNYVVRPKGFDMDAGNAVVVGDMEFAQMAKKLTESTQMSLADARTFLRESAGATLKSRHRFFGNMMKRKGAEGFDKNIMWVLAHYFNSSARYIAMEEFKPAAISFYERCFGAFDSEPKNMTARYCKDLINDVNGNPRGVEVWLNDLIKGTWLGKRIADSYGDRAALAVNGELSTWNAITKLGLFNFASAAVNFSQFINVGAALNDYGYAAKGLMRALHPTALDKKIIEASGLLEDINLAADNGGYSQRRGGKVRGIYSGIKNVGEKSLFLFQKADTLMRKAAVLGAYYQGVEQKGMEKAPGDALSAKAIAYAQQINDDANFDYSAANAPGMLRAGSVITQQLFQFQKYPIMQFEFMYNILKNGTRGQKVRMLVPYVLFCGIGGSIPFGELFNQLFSFLFGIATGDDEDIARDIKAEILRWAGKDPVKKSVAETALYGVLAPTFGLDISGRIGMSNAFSGEFYGQKPDSVSGVVAQQLGGPMAATAINMLHQAHEGNPIEALKAVSPALGNMFQAAVGVSRTTHHRVNTRYDSAYDKIVHALGFRSVEESSNAFVTNYDYEMRTKDKHTKQDAIQSYIDDPSDANRRTLNALGIKDRQVKEAQIQQERTAKERAKNGRPNTNGKNGSSQHKKEVKRETLLSATDDEE